MNIYTDRAEIYARYRWDYAADAYRAIFTIAGLDPSSVVVDLGAGTGICTRHFAGCVKQVFAVEPDPGMCAAAARHLAGCLDCTVLAGSAENIPLPAHSADLVIVAQAIHWFHPDEARLEITRVLRPGGWLAVLNNHPTDAQLGRAINAISTPENGVDRSRAAQPGINTPLSAYFGSQSVKRLVFPISLREDWEYFWGAMLSASYMPNAQHPAYPRLEMAAQGVFEQFSSGGWLEVHGETVLTIGQVGKTGPGDC